MNGERDFQVQKDNPKISVNVTSNRGRSGQCASHERCALRELAGSSMRHLLVHQPMMGVPDSPSAAIEGWREGAARLIEEMYRS